MFAQRRQRRGGFGGHRARDQHRPAERPAQPLQPADGGEIQSVDRADIAPQHLAEMQRRAEGQRRQPLRLPHLSLLKIQFGAIEDRDKQRGASPILRGSTFVAMMQAANLREGNYVVACTG